MRKIETHVIGIPLSTCGHSHPHAHILIPLAEALQVHLDGKDYYIDNQQLCVVLSGVVHHCLCPTEIISVNIPESMIKKNDIAVFERNVVFPIAGVLVQLVELIKTEVVRNPDSDSLRYLYYYLYDKLVEANVSKSQKYIQEHFSETISIATLAQIENYNLSYFTDWFKKQTGLSPSNYLRNFRIEKAKELLLNTHYRLIEIAMQVGYNSNASFTRAFKETAGVSPMSYRLQTSPFPEKES